MFEYLRSQQPPDEDKLEEGDLPNEWSNLMQASQNLEVAQRWLIPSDKKATS